MEITGERTVPGIAHENYRFRRHEAVYEWLLPHVVGADVLEAGSGEGYGAGLMSARASSVVALDYDAVATCNAARRCSDVPVGHGNLVQLPFPDGCFDGMVSLQTVESTWGTRKHSSPSACGCSGGRTVRDVHPEPAHVPAGQPLPRA